MARKRAIVPADELYTELDADLERIYSEIRRLKVNQHIFWKVQEMIRNNPDLKKPSTFYQWMGNMYAAGMTVAIRRLVDRTNGTVSFVRMLNRLKTNPQCVSREWYTKRFYKPEHRMPRGYLDKDYDKLVGIGRDCPDPKQIEQEIQAITGITSKLKKFVDEQVAHSSRQQSTGPPTFQEVDDAVDVLEKLLVRYLWLFRSTFVASALPVWQFDWTEIFRYPWLPPNSPPP